MVFASLRIGLYEPVKNLYVGENHVGPISIFTRILAALTTGAFGIMIANPTDVVKIRFQAEGRKP
jgi:solute carrier family 25 uncoupling protein 8/9